MNEIYEFEEFISHEDFEALMPMVSTLVAVWLGILAIGAVVGFVLYIIRSLALQTIAKRRGIKNAWLVWLPVGTEWIIGSLSDQYKYLTQGKNQVWRKVLLWLNVVTLVIGFISGFLGVFQSLMEMGDMIAYNSATEEQVLGVMLPLVLSMVCTVVSGVVSIVAYVFKQICMYDIYKSCDPKNAVVFLVFGILIGLTEPFFLLYCRNKDLGMPPRRAAVEAPLN